MIYIEQTIRKQIANLETSGAPLDHRVVRMKREQLARLNMPMVMETRSGAVISPRLATMLADATWGRS